MRILQSSIFRALCAVVFGYLLVMYREQMLHWTTIAFGGLFFLSGLISVIVYYAEKRRAANTAQRLAAMAEMREGEMEAPSDKAIKQSLAPAFPVVGIGSMVLGVVLGVMPTTFIHGLMYAIAGLVILGAISLMFNLAMARKFAHIGAGFWIMPVLLLVLGVLMVAKPDLFATMPFRVLGWALIAYGIIECINSLKIHQCRKQYDRIQAAQAAATADAEDAIIIEDTTQNP